METKTKNGVAPGKAARSKNLEVLEKPQRRRFTTEEKLRVLRETDSCPPGTIGAILRREGLYSSLLAAWRQARDRGDLDPGTLRQRVRRKGEHEASRRRIAELERENRKLQRRLQRAELIVDIQKKAAGLLGIDLKSPDENDNG
jgi:transposase